MSAAIFLGRAYPRHEATFAFARGAGAALVRCGSCGQLAVARMLVGWIRETEPEPMMIGNPGLPAEQAIVWVLGDSVEHARVAAVFAEDDVCRVLAPLLDDGVPVATARQAALDAAAGRLEPDEVEALLRIETAWWVRLHAQVRSAPTRELTHA